jgi:serine phosphatase RsbU (regulator of sigma subunit)
MDPQSTLELVRHFTKLVRFTAMYGEEHQQPKQALDALKQLLDRDLQAEPKIAIALQGRTLIVQGVCQPDNDAAVESLTHIMRTRATNSLSFHAGVGAGELMHAARLFAMKPAEVLAEGEVKPDLLKGLERLRINDVRYVALEESQAVVNADEPLPADVGAAVQVLAGEGAGTGDGGGPGGGGVAPPAPGRTVTIPVERLASLLRSRGLPEARRAALETVVGGVIPGGGSVAEQLARAVEQLPEELRKELSNPAGRAELSAGVVARQLETGADPSAVRDVVRDLAPQAADAVPLLENLARILPEGGKGASLETLERLMKFLPDVDRLEEALRGRVLVVDGNAERRGAYANALAEYGYLVETAETAAEAAEKAVEGGDFVAIVTDLMLPDRSCETILGKLKRARLYLPVVIASPKAQAAAHDFEIFSYPKKKLLPLQDPAAVAEAVRDVAVRHERPEEEADREDRKRAREIQEKLVPRDLPPVPGWDHAFAYKPAKEVGGDYLDVFPLDGDRLGFVVGDVSGKGFSGAMVMVMVRSAFRLSAPGLASPRETVAAVNRLIRPDMKRGMFVSIVYGCLHVPSGELTVVNAGHNPPVLSEPYGEKTRMMSHGGMPLGVADPPRFDPMLREDRVSLLPGGRIVFYTDGVVEALNAKDAEFGEKAFLDLVTRTAADTSQQVVSATLIALASHRAKAAQSDDITILDLKRV